MQIGEETAGKPDLQLGYKKDASLGGVQPIIADSSHGASSEASGDTSLDGVRDDLKNRKPYGVSSKVSINIVPQSRENTTGLLRKIQNDIDYAAVAV